MSGFNIFSLGATDTSSRYARFYDRFGDAQVASALRIRHDAEAGGDAQREHRQLVRTVDSRRRNHDLGSTVAYPSDHHAAKHGAADKIQHCHIASIIKWRGVRIKNINN